MAKSRKLEELLATLAQIQENPTSVEGRATLRHVLSSKFSIAIARAAKLVAASDLFELIPELVAAFDRLISSAKETDQGCLAKHAIAEALYRLDYSDETLFLQGIRHVQMEAVWGGQEDTAAALRGTCALGLVRMNYPEVMSELADLLADPKPAARVAAARAIAYSENPAGVPLLRLRIKVGDELPVFSECIMALLKLAPTQSLPLMQTLLQIDRPLLTAVADGGKVEAVALALAESQLPQAFSILRQWWEKVPDRELRQSALLAIATLRQTDAQAFLLTLIGEGSLQDAKDAIHALGIYRQDAQLWQRIQHTVEQRGEPRLSEMMVEIRR
jgi:HEAT repeat protein